MENNPLLISPLLHISKVSFNVPDPGFDRDPTVHETSSSLCSGDEELVNSHSHKYVALMKF